MIAELNVLALIPARGGSKGLPGKNLRPLCGRPLVQWSIDTALACSKIDSVIVSTDDEKIAELALLAGAEVPFLRPQELSGDTATSIEVVIHALDFLENTGRRFDVVILLEPTSPLRDMQDIDLALQHLVDAKASSIVSVCRAEATHPAFMFKTTSHGRLKPFLSSPPTSLRRQQIEPVFYLDGSLYASRVKALRTKKSFYHNDTIAHEVSKWKAIEIDDIEDFQMTEAIIRYRGLA